MSHAPALGELPTVTTAEQLLALGPRRSWRLELVDGEVRQMAAAGYRHGVTSARVTAVLHAFAEEHGLGEVVGSETGFVVRRRPDTVLAPDVAFVAAGRLPENVAGFAELTPDLVVEVVSPWDRRGEVDAKARLWLEVGARLVWVLWPEPRAVDVHTVGAEPLHLAESEVLDGGDVLPDFSVKVADLFG